MQRIKYILSLTIIYLLLSSCGKNEEAATQLPQVSDQKADMPASTSFVEDTNTPTLTKIAEHTFYAGTHRPEILFYDDELYLVVVQPSQEAHDVGYIFDASDPNSIDFSAPETEFIAVPASKEMNIGDHRIALVNNELWMVYQVLKINKEKMNEAVGRKGPMEQYATEQSLLFSRFSLEGEKRFTTTILTSTDFDENNFPDMSVAATDKTLLVSTGATGKLYIREIGNDGSILQTYLYETSPETIPETIGNSLLFGPDNGLYIFSYFFSEAKTLALTVLDSTFMVKSIVQLPVEEEREQSFPTGVLSYESYYFVGYITRATGGSPALEDNPYHPALKILDSDFNVVYDEVVSTDNMHGHGHPNLAFVGDRLFYAWSKDVSGSPQVMIEEYQIN